MEGYLDTISNRTYRPWYSKMRICNHRFAYETGRFSKTPMDEILCLFCINKTKKQHSHLLLHFPCYELHGKQLYNCINELCPNFKYLKDD